MLKLPNNAFSDIYCINILWVCEFSWEGGGGGGGVDKGIIGSVGGVDFRQHLEHNM